MKLDRESQCEAAIKYSKKLQLKKKSQHQNKEKGESLLQHPNKGGNSCNPNLHLEVWGRSWMLLQAADTDACPDLLLDVNVIYNKNLPVPRSHFG